MIEKSDTQLSSDIKEQSKEIIIAEYERKSALERDKLEFMEKILQTYIAIASAVVAGIVLIGDKGSILGISNSLSDGLLAGLLLFGIIALFRTVNSNIALMELAKELDILRQFFIDYDISLSRYFLVGLVDDSKKLHFWASMYGILGRGITRGGDKGYLAIITFFNSICSGTIAISMISKATTITSISLTIIIGVGVFLTVSLLQVIYVSYRYGVMQRHLESRLFSTLNR